MLPTSSGVTVQIDTEAGAAYLRLGRGQVARTMEFSEDVYVDLDEFDMLLGIELIDLDRSIPLDELAERFNIATEPLSGLVSAIRWGSARPTFYSASMSPDRAVSFGTVVAAAC